jgi:prepilin-type N-terminal cleavage/methylation domain-containing protein
MTSSSPGKQKGFSLLEVLVTIAIFSLVALALNGFILGAYRAYYYNFKQIAAINEARRGIDIMIKEIRELKTGDDGSYAIAQAGDQQFIFYSDIDRDGVTEKVRYFLNNTDLSKGVIKPTGDPPFYDGANETISVISQYVQNNTGPIFTYYNGDWPGDTTHNPLPTLTRLSDTKLMHVDLIINTEPSRPPGNFELQSDAQIRNLKTNL